MGIASCYIRIGIFDMAETVQYIDKFIHQLYLINNDIVKFLVLDSVVNIVKHHFHPAENEEEGDWMTPMEILSFLQTKTKDRLSINKVALFGRALHKLGISSRRKTRGTEYHVVKKE